MKSLAVVSWLWTNVGQHGSVAGQRAKTLSQNLGHFAFTARKVLLSIKDSKDDIAKAG